MTHPNLQALRAEYPRGVRIRLVRTSDPYTRLRPGVRGTVQMVDDWGTVHVRWDSGHQLGMVLDSGDEIARIHDT